MQDISGRQNHWSLHSSDEEVCRDVTSMDEDNVCIAGMDHRRAPAIPQDGEGARMFGAHSASGAGSNPTTLPF